MAVRPIMLTLAFVFHWLRMNKENAFCAAGNQLNNLQFIRHLALLNVPFTRNSRFHFSKRPSKSNAV
jgi:hypothetical protein